MSLPGRPPRLADCVGVILPARETTVFLKACLGIGTAEHWRLWTAGRPDLPTTLGWGGPELKRLLPLLAHALEADGIALDERTRAALRLASLWEERRAARVRAILAEALGALAAAGVQPVLLNGVALAETAYPKPALRHCHDIDLLVATPDLARAADALRRIGCGETRRPGRRTTTLCLVHTDGLPISLHSQWPWVAFSRPDPGIRARTRAATIAGVHASILSPPDTLLGLCARLVTGAAGDSASWVADAVYLLRAHPLAPEDWRVLATAAEDSGLSLPLYAMVEYLGSEVGTAIPEPVLGLLRDGAARTPAAQREALLTALRRGAAGRFREMIRRSGWRSRLQIVRWLLAPAPAFLRTWCGEQRLRWWPAWYVARPVRGLIIRAVAFGRSLERSRHEVMGSRPVVRGEARCEPDLASVSPVRLSDLGLRREAPRPLHDRQSGYEALFDHDTLFYDVFRSGEEVICLGPPLLNCEDALQGAEFRIEGSDRPLASAYRPPRLDRQPTCRFHLSGPGLLEAPKIVLSAVGRSLLIRPRSSGREAFVGRRVVTTVSKDNPLDWIKDWARFNVRVHHADAFIIYDNGSTLYGCDDIRDALADLDGLERLLVIPWHYPYGPRAGPARVQDSFYCHPGALDHVRRRYCPAARAVLNTDVDELVVGAPGESVFDAAERSGRAVYSFRGVWVEKTGDDGSPGLVRHTDCLDRRRPPVFWAPVGRLNRWLRTKWVAVPARCDDDMAWAVHDVLDCGTAPRTLEWSTHSREFVYRHCRQITIGRSAWRKRVDARSILRHAFDRDLAAAFAIAFPERTLPRGR